MQDIESKREKLLKLLDGERFRHSESVESEAARLASIWGVAPDKARLAGLLHDSSRFMDPSQMLDLAKKLGLPFGPIEEIEPKLLHAGLSAHVAKKDFGVSDPEVLQAIERHTIGRPGMSLLDKIIYLADHIEPTRDYEGVIEIRELSSKDLNRAIVASTSAMIDYLVSKGYAIHPGTVETRNYYLLNPGK